MDNKKNMIHLESEKIAELAIKQNQVHVKSSTVHKPQISIDKPKNSANITASVVDHSKQVSADNGINDDTVNTDNQYLKTEKIRKKNTIRKSTESKRYTQLYNKRAVDSSKHKPEYSKSKSIPDVKQFTGNTDSSKTVSTSPHLKMISQNGLKGIEKCINNVTVKPGKEVIYKASDQAKQFCSEDEWFSTSANVWGKTKSVSSAADSAFQKGKKAVKRTAKAAKKTAKATQKTAQATAKAAKETANATAKAATFTARVAASVTHAIVAAVSAFISFIAPFLPIILIVILIIAFVATLIGVLSWLFDGKTMDVEITKAYSYVTELDAKFTQTTYNTAYVLNHSGQSYSFKYYLNDNEIAIENLQIETDVETLIALYNTIYKDGWEFYPASYAAADKTLVNVEHSYDKGVFGGRTIKEDIECLHETLFSFRYEITDEKDTSNKSIVKVYIDQLLVADILETYKEQTQELFDDMEVDMDVNEFLNLYTQDVGTFTFRNEIQNPLGDKKSDIKNRFGYFFKKDTAQEGSIAEITGHAGVDIYGSETDNLVYAGVKGTVIERTTDPNMGGVVVIKLDDKSDGKERVLALGHLGLFYVNVGDKVTIDTQIGLMANNLVSDDGCGEGYFLHIEYMIDGYILCPSIYISGLQQNLK